MDVACPMNKDFYNQKKSILNDPIEFISAHRSDINTNEINLLDDLCSQFKRQQKEYQEVERQKALISREIGKAKSNNQPATKLIQSMQERSTQSTKLEERLYETEKQILKFIEPYDDMDTHDEKSSKTVANQTTPRRRHKTIEEKLEIADVKISLFNNEDSAWNNYVTAHPAATIHHLTHWRNILKKTYNIESLYFFAHDNNHKVVGILPLTRLKSRLFGDLLVSMPYFQRGGAIADHPMIEKKLIDAATKEASRLGVDHIEFRDDIPREGLPVHSHKVSMILSLPNTTEALWSNFSPKLRAQIKRPQQLTPQVLIGGKEYTNDFYKVYSQNMRDLGSPAHSKRLVENILDKFPNSSWIIVIRLDNKPVSAALLLGHSDTMEVPLASTIRKANPHSMNMLLYWEILKLAIKHRYNKFDFGRSSKNSGTYRFKRQWGAQPVQLFWHYWLRDTNELPYINPSNPKYAIAINIWKLLPVRFTRWLGPLIIKNIP